MIFGQIEDIIQGRKTQTRRLVRQSERVAKIAPGTPLEFMQIGTRWGDIVAVRRADGRLKYEVGRDYAVQPGRGRMGVQWNPDTGSWYAPAPDVLPSGIGPTLPLLVQIVGIRQEPLTAITCDDALAEGIYPVGDVMYTYAGGPASWDPIAAYENLWRSINRRRGTRWEDNPQVWVLNFQVVR